MRVGAGLSLEEESEAAAREAATQAARPLGGEQPDLAVVFVSPHHAQASARMLDVIHEVAAPKGLIGCVAEAVLGGRQEVEGHPGVSVWLGRLPGGVDTVHPEFVRTTEGGIFAGWRVDPEAPPGAVILVCDPFTFPADLLLSYLNETVPGTPVIGGMASGAVRPGETLLFHDHEVVESGAVAAVLNGVVRVRTLVSQGCRPIGQSFVVTQAEENVLQGLGGRPPLERLRETAGRLSAADRELLDRGIHLGRVIDEYKAEYGTGDFLIRGVIGADPDTGAMAVGDRLEVGQTVQFHVRDAATADEELRSIMERSMASLPGRVAGALLFTCNGRGTRMFRQPNHDAGLISSYLGAAPMSGFFCAGELGPVGGRNFLHGFTASLAVFVDGGASTED